MKSQVISLEMAVSYVRKTMESISDPGIQLYMIKCYVLDHLRRFTPEAKEFTSQFGAMTSNGELCIQWPDASSTLVSTE